MTAKSISKLIVSHRGALKAKYGGAGLKQVEAALARLVKADAKRGITTSLALVDTDDVPKKLRVKSSRSAKNTKRAVDHLYTEHGKPDYLLLLGAPDVIPYQPLDNPLPVGTAEDEDPDPIVYSDLPYACEAGYSTTIKDFIGPTRAVGRLPDLNGGKVAAYLVDLIDGSAKHAAGKTLGARFGLSTQTWPKATTEVLHRAFGSSPALRVAPPDMAPVPASALAPMVHLINCHGDTHEPRYFGEDAETEEMDPSLTPADVEQTRQRGTLAVAECCYGTELYKAKGAKPICSAYLAQGAVGFMGSTTTAYGADSAKIEDADVLCSKFLQLVAGKASLGRALLEARLFFVEQAKRFSGFELKTLAQFGLLGDPSLRAVEPSGAMPEVAGKKAKGKGQAQRAHAASPPAPTKAFVARHARHRAKLRHEGQANQHWAGTHALKLTRVAAPAARVQMAVAMTAPHATHIRKAKGLAAARPAGLAATFSDMASDAALAAQLVTPRDGGPAAEATALYRFTWIGPGKTVARKESETLFCFTRSERDGYTWPKLVLHVKAKAAAGAKARSRARRAGGRPGPRRRVALVARLEGGEVAEVVRLVSR